MDLIERAEVFAVQAHGPQKRKYTGEPYIVHPIEVMNIVKTVKDKTDAMLAAALLHDVIEDTEATYDDVLVNFGPLVADFVL